MLTNIAAGAYLSSFPFVIPAPLTFQSRTARLKKIAVFGAFSFPDSPLDALSFPYSPFGRGLVRTLKCARAGVPLHPCVIRSQWLRTRCSKVARRAGKLLARAGRERARRNARAIVRLCGRGTSAHFEMCARTRAIALVRRPVPVAA